MLLADVNILLYAAQPASPQHDEYRAWLEDRLSGPEPFGVSEMVLSSVVRLSTNHRVYREPASPDEAIDFCESILRSPAALAVRAGSRHWSIFADLCRQIQARANDVPDAFLAALVIEHGATLATADRSFARFPGLRIEHPLARSSRT